MTKCTITSWASNGDMVLTIGARRYTYVHVPYTSYKRASQLAQHNNLKSLFVLLKQYRQDRKQVAYASASFGVACIRSIVTSIDNISNVSGSGYSTLSHTVPDSSKHQQ